MLNLQNNQYKVPIVYGFYGAILAFFFYFMLLFSGNSPWSSASWMGCWIPGVTAIFSIKKYLSLKSEPFSTFSETFKIAIIAVVVQAMMYNLLVLITGNLIDTGAIEMYRDEVMESMTEISALLGDEMYEKIVEGFEQITLLSSVLSDFIYKIIGGIIVSLILAAIFKKNKPVFRINE